jgi:hypothetical protein
MLASLPYGEVGVMPRIGCVKDEMPRGHWPKTPAQVFRLPVGPRAEHFFCLSPNNRVEWDIEPSALNGTTLARIRNKGEAAYLLS